MCHLLERHGTEEVIVKAYEEIWNFKQGWVTLRGSSHSLSDLTLLYSTMYKEQTLRAFFAESIELTVRYTMRCW